MKETLTTITLYTVLIGGLVAGNWFDQAGLLRLSLWATWALIIVLFCALCSPSEEFFKKPQLGYGYKRLLWAIYIVLLIATGWMVAATLCALGWVGLWLKSKAYQRRNK